MKIFNLFLALYLLITSCDKQKIFEKQTNSDTVCDCGNFSVNSGFALGYYFTRIESDLKSKIIVYKDSVKVIYKNNKIEYKLFINSGDYVNTLVNEVNPANIKTFIEIIYYLSPKKGDTVITDLKGFIVPVMS